MIACANKSSVEWKDLVKKYDGDEDLAQANWNRDTEDSELELTKDAPEKSELAQLVDKVKLFLQKKLAILEKKNIPNKKRKENELKRIIDNIKALDEVNTINTFIEESYANIKQAESQFDSMLKNKENLSRHEMIEKLSAFNDFANGYSILDELSQTDIEEYFSKSEKGLNEQGTFSIQDKLSYAILARDKIKQRYLKQGIPLLADYLLESKSTKLSDKVLLEIASEEKKLLAAENSTSFNDKVKARKIKESEDRIKVLKEYDLDKESLIKQLKLATADEGAIDYLFSPLISSEDSVLALFAKSVKSELENARLKDIKFAEQAQKEFDNFIKNNNKSRDNVEKFNSDLYEEIEVPTGRTPEGVTIYKKEKAFVQKYDVSAFARKQEEFFKRIGKKPVDNPVALKSWNKSVSEWFRANTQPKSESERTRIIEEKNKELETGIVTQEEYDTWVESVISQYGEEVTFKRELAEPSDAYLNKKWLNLYAEDGVPANDAGKYHMFLVDSYLTAQEKLPEHFRKGYTLPSIPKGNIERVQTQGVLETGKKRFNEAIKVQNYDDAFGISGLEDGEAKFLPVFFTQSMDANDVSSDLISSILRFNSMVNRYESLNNISAEVALTKTVVGSREVVETNSKGKQIMDAFAKKHGYNEFIKQNGESNSKKHLDAFIDMIVYGEMQKKEELFGLDAGKLTNTLTGFSAVTTLAVDLLKATANNIQGNIQVTIEANSEDHFNKTNYKNGKAFYVKSVPEMLGDFGKISPDSLPSKLIDLYDAIQGEFKDKYGKNVSGSIARKLFTTDTLFFNQHLAEHEIQISALFAILDANKVKDLESGESISLLKAYEKYGIDIEEKTDFTEAKRKDIMNSHHAVAKRLHGVYNEFDKGTAQRYALGRIALMYRKYLIPSYKRRFKRLSGDQEAGVLTEGFYRTFVNTFIRDLRDYQFNVLKNWETYSDFEKGQIKRVMAETAWIASLTALVLFLKVAGDDDEELKKSYFYNFVLYQATRQRSETFAYLSPRDAYRTVKSPSALTTTFDRTIKLVDQLFFTWDPDKLTYTKKTGVWNKGTNKSWAYFLKMIGLSGYNANPDEAVKAFEGTLNK